MLDFTGVVLAICTYRGFCGFSGVRERNSCLFKTAVFVLSPDGHKRCRFLRLAFPSAQDAALGRSACIGAHTALPGRRAAARAVSIASTASIGMRCSVIVTGQVGSFLSLRSW
jgi:hypothetical protein